nr:MAG TPA: hypothetical protein [Caudoviricetes sp.]
MKIILLCTLLLPSMVMRESLISIIFLLVELI